MKVYNLLPILFLILACNSNNKYKKEMGTKGNYILNINMSDTNAILHLGDTLATSFNYKSTIETDKGEQINVSEIYHANSFIAWHYSSHDSHFVTVPYFLKGNIDGSKIRSYYKLAPSGSYTDYFIPQETGVYFFYFIPQAEQISVVSTDNILWHVQCYDRFNVSNTHDELVTNIIPSWANDFQKNKTAGQGYYCFKVVP